MGPNSRDRARSRARTWSMKVSRVCSEPRGGSWKLEIGVGLGVRVVEVRECGRVRVRVLEARDWGRAWVRVLDVRDWGRARVRDLDVKARARVRVLEVRASARARVRARVCSGSWKLGAPGGTMP